MSRIYTIISIAIFRDDPDLMNITNTLLFFAMQRILTFYQQKITVYLLM